MKSPFVAGVFVGLAVGAGATFLAVSKPWQGEAEESVAVVELDAGVSDETGTQKGKRKRRRRAKGKTNAAGLQIIDERVELSAADRKMVWRGPAVRKSAQAMDFNSSGEARSLRQDEINQGVAAREGKLSRCIGDARGQAELAAKITLKFLVSGEGNATKVRVRAPSYLIKHGLYDCFGRVVRGMNFPSTGGETVVTLPFDLSF